MRIAFGFEARSGKDAACDYLIKKYGGTKLRFADKLYEAMYAVQDILGFKREKNRDLLTGLADLVKKQNYDVFVNEIERKILKTEGNIFIADLRFENEAKMLKANGFKLVKIIRSKNEIERKIDHISEKELATYEFDFIINNTTLSAFYDNLDSLYCKISLTS